MVKPEEGALLHYGVHLIDLLCWYLSDMQPMKVVSFLHSRPGEQRDTEAAVTIVFSDGVISPGEGGLDEGVHKLGGRGQIRED